MAIKNNKLVMVLEYDTDLAEGIELSLQSDELNFVICETIAEARIALDHYSFDLLIFDINLPDGNGLEFYKNGTQIELSKTEQRILYLLTSNSNRILTRERLLEWVWPERTEYVEDNALSVGIRRLRDKLEDDSSNPIYIKTVYGKGYVWESV